MKKTFIAAAVAASFIPAGLMAAEAGKLKVEESVEINAPADAVWQKVNNFGDLGAWHPAVKTTEIVSGTNNKTGAVRLLTLQDNGTIKEQLVSYKPAKKSYTYKILEGVLPVSHYVSTITVKPLTVNTTKVTWKGNFNRKDMAAASPAEADAESVKVITSVYRGGLDNLKKISE